MSIASVNTDQLSHYKSKLAFETDSWDLYEALSRNEPVVVVDGRSAEAFAREHIPGAVNLPHREIDEHSTVSLDRSKLYVCYCDGIGCNASTKTALMLLTLGFRCARASGRARLVEARRLRHRGDEAAGGDRGRLRVLRPPRKRCAAGVSRVATPPPRRSPPACRASPGCRGRSESRCTPVRRASRTTLCRSTRGPASSGSRRRCHPA